ncbi:DNA-directed RNA polymerase III subunit RPC3 [Fistulifera solaris]|uniref:DNA-directed RNA polymerase III subunit RPC3 n=1 Tax=Fistulifera solaris TaxID=1519565 RepID=A0A1Z5KEX3_FISSO|nr:DNA-directed RNA polymerase III subunit RPC3 [Fistulifera solaris]|eukprot:GAX24767.1 DNA-directed RNA polymerase III subunit RPC3 [Fistulifera solaris]
MNSTSIAPSSSPSTVQKQAAALGALVHRSAWATSNPNPLTRLALHNVRSAFGECVEVVADILQAKGGRTLRQLLLLLKPEMDASTVRAALLVLMQHSLVSFQPSTNIYNFHLEAALRILRWPRYLECTKKFVDETAAWVLESLMLQGRWRTVDLLTHVSAPKKSDRYTSREQVLQALYKLVQMGCVIPAKPLASPLDEEEEQELIVDCKVTEEPLTKRVKIEEPFSTNEENYEDFTIIALLEGSAHYKATLPVDTVWKVNAAYFHDRLRANTLGKLVHERFGGKIPSCGSFVQAALLHRLTLKHGKQHSERIDASLFTPQDVIQHMPKPVLQTLEKRSGGVLNNLTLSLQELSRLQHPTVLRLHADDLFEVDITSLMEYLHKRMAHKIVCDRSGETAGRILSILSVLGSLESDKIAQHAMVPVKDTREILHRMYRQNYLELMTLNRSASTSMQHYVWSVSEQFSQVIVRDTAHALYNLRLRRQRQVQVGKEWIERAQRAAVTEENDHETDRVNYQKFCVGLERLDHAVLQLDEMLMVLRDFQLR